ncbi:MAG: MFS transporter [Candidatus Thermoplasmatota archaeon]|jgi:putative MFS transporter|uniref:MFS transporter n=1 Tax=Ferroplasma sp. TaxID=2591003 RepID=UPI0026307BC5|nr:MFS transporter [Ferroplasma sp.]MCL4310884.1 MFS transporter [Candidatus Thermoplasmatota archaeon]
MQNKPYEGSVSDRLERLPFSSVQRDFLLMVAGGEWAETLMLLGNGAVLALAGHALGLTGLAPVMIATAFFLGEFVGSAFFGWLADRKGRKFVFLYNLLVFSFGMLMAGFMSLPYLIAIFVFIGGIGVGGEFPLVDSFTTEMMPAKVRGNRLALVYTIAVTAGFVIAFLAYEMGIIVPLYYSWRILFWFMAVVGFGVWAVRTRLKESPRWLEVHGEYKKADEITTDWEQRTMKAKHLSELPKPTTNTPIEENRSRYRDMFEPDVRKRSIMMIIFQFFQSGIFYGFTALAPFFLIKKGFNLPTTLGFVFLIFTGFFFGSVFNLFIIDKVERKWGIIGSAVLAGIFGTAFAVATNVYLVVIFGFITTFILWNFSNFFHTYQAEIFPTRIRPTAAGTVYAVSRVSTAILIIFIADIFLPHGVVASFGIIWVFIAIVVLDLWILGPKSSREQVETIAQ